MRQKAARALMSDEKKEEDPGTAGVRCGSKDNTLPEIITKWIAPPVWYAENGHPKSGPSMIT